MENVILTVPSALASSLIADELADEVIVWRGVDVVSLLTLAADATSALTAVVASRQAFAQIAQRLVGHVSDEAADSPDVSVSITAPQGTAVLVETNTPVGLTRLVIRIQAAIQDAIDAQAGDDT